MIEGRADDRLNERGGGEEKGERAEARREIIVKKKKRGELRNKGRENMGELE